MVLNSMVFSVVNPKKYTLTQAKSLILPRARQKILLYPMRSTEIKLNNYCLKNYKKSLKQICLNLLGQLVYSADDQNIVLTFNNETAEKLALLITYGNLDIGMGSDILSETLH